MGNELVTLAVCSYFVIGAANGGCPVMKQSFEYGQQHFASVSKRQADLISEGFVLDEGPAVFFWNTSQLELETSIMVNKSSTLIFASQFYNELSLENDLQFLTNAQKLDNLREMSNCLPESDRCAIVNATCDSTDRFQQMNGLCNNIYHPSWSAQNSAYLRIGEPNYIDGIHEMPRSVLTNAELPPARLIGNVALKKLPFTTYPTKIGNYGGLIYGQFITHDVSRRNSYQNYEGSFGLRCCSIDSSHELPDDLRPFGCAAINIPSDDPIMPFYNVSCLNMIRSQTTLPNDCIMGVAQKQNIVTGVLDVSNVYGSNDDELAPLRSFTGGKLAIVNGVLPINPNCTTPGNCYTNGDILALFQPTLALMHSLFYRFHNKIADQLAIYHKNWDDERLFQETRRIIIAVHQHFTYDEWLPLFTGDSSQQNNETCTNSLYCGKYDPTLDPSPAHEFSQSAFRLYHEFIPTMFNTFDTDYTILSSTNISDSVINLNVLNTQYEDYLRGYMLTPISFDVYSYALRNNIFRFENPIGMDLLSDDIIVGRDHGVLPYYVYKDKVMGTNSTDWTDLSDTISEENIALLATLYESMYDVDLYVGMSLEKRDVDYLGPVAKSIVADQFYRSKFGNRFFYTFEEGPYPFTSPQLTEIKRYTLADMYCEVTNISEVQPRAMEVPNDVDNALQSCKDFKPFNVSLFKKTCS